MPKADYAQRVIELMFSVSRLMKTKMAAMARTDHVNWVQIHALCMIQERKGITMKELANMLMVTAPTATSFVNRLVRDSLVTRQADPKNRTLVRLHISKKGKQLMQSKIRQRQMLIRKVISILPSKDQRELVRILENLLHSYPGTKA